MSENCTWNDYGTPIDTELLHLRIAQGGHSITAVVSPEQFDTIQSAISSMDSFKIEQQAEKRRIGATFVVVPTRGGLLLEVTAIPRIKDTRIQVLNGRDARLYPKPEIKVILEAS